MFGYTPQTINRSALIIRPKQPYIDWANSFDDGPEASVEQLPKDHSIYLVDCIDELADIDLLVQDHWEWIFQEQLNGWMRDSDLWPEEMTREMFLEWFDCELSTMIWDMLKSKIKPSF